MTPLFRVNARELLYTIPFVVYFTANAVSSLSPLRWRTLAAETICGILLTWTLGGVPIPSLRTSVSDRATAVMNQPRGRPSRAAAQWLLQNTTINQTILAT